MNEELSTLVQIINLYGRTLGALGSAIRLSAEGAKGGIDIARLKIMQHKMKLHYASTGTRDTMRLSDLEKLTGENYAILNIPLENDKDLKNFYDALKKVHVSFAELPDLNLGDGYTQIAYDPQDGEKLKAVVAAYKELLRKKPSDISIEDYIHTANEKGIEYLNDLALKGYREAEVTELIERMRERNMDPAYTAIAFNREKMLIKETKEAYYLRIPEKGIRSYSDNRDSYAIRVDKCDAVYIDGGKSIFTHIKESSGITLFAVDEKGQLYESLTHTEHGYDIATRFSEVPKRTIEKVNHMTAADTEMLPDFTRGQGRENITSVREEISGTLAAEDNNLDRLQNPKHSDTADKTHSRQYSEKPGQNLEAMTTIREQTPEEQLTNVLKYEELKDRYLSDEYMITDIDLEKNLIIKGPSQYIVALPGDWGEDEIYTVGIGIKDSVLSDDGKMLRTFIHKDADIKVSRLHSTGKLGDEFILSGDEIMRHFLGVKDEFKLGEAVKEVERLIPKPEVPRTIRMH